MSGKALKASLSERCESILTRLPSLGPNADYLVSVRVLLLLTTMKRQARIEPIDAEMMQGVIDAAMRARRLFAVEGADGKPTIRQHPAPARVPARKH